MAEDNQNLEEFFANSAPKEEKKEETVSLENEFARLLNDFIQDENNTTKEKKLDDFATSETPSTTNNDLDSFVTKEPLPSATSANLDSFVTTEQPSSGKEDVGELPKMFEKIVATPIEENNDTVELKAEEYELSRAIINFKEGIISLADKKNLKTPETDYEDKMLYPNYKPSVGKKIAKYILECWDILNKYDPENMKRLSKDASDEEYLTFAETLTDTDMQLSIISYVEILINLEICEVKYEQLKEIAVKNRIKKELYEEYIKLQERKTLFIQKIKEQKFPIDVDKLINNYFNVAQKDSKGAFTALTKNPAMFSPIEFDKIKPKFFGLIKVTPEDGIKYNQKIGAFIKKIKI